ncbi:TPA: hypothetical protein DCP88_03770 [Candidatus Campbellbacteria bacterium]|nr:MAG: hypothetical protein UR58_C0001G0046 [Candidatus Campbellbacteria bacterium GW2011_OD1_34_28]HAP74409.1 hypothetical protein [Candidatus Campbellbacteria bacterium]
MNLIDKFIKQFFIVFAVMLMLGGGFLANDDNLLFLQKVEASEVQNISNLNTVEKTAVYVYRTISGFFSSAEETADSGQLTTNSTNEDEISRGLSSESEADRGEISENVPSVPATPKTTTIVTNPIREIIKETVVERVIQTPGVTLEDLQKLNNELRSEIYKLSSNTNAQITNTYQVISATNDIDNLGGVEIYDSNISTSNVSGTELNFTNGNISNLTIDSAVFDTDTLVIDSVNNRVSIGTTTSENAGAKLSVYGRVSQTGLGGSTYFGYEAGRSDDLTDNYNVGIGYQSLRSNTSGYRNAAVGYQSLYSNTTGYLNASFGYKSLHFNTEGYNNVASGYTSLYSNTTGNNNIASGSYALFSNIGGSRNIASGSMSLYANISGGYNIALGTESLVSNTTGGLNSAVGDMSLYSNTTGASNVGIGDSVLYNNSTGSYNVAIGINSLAYGGSPSRSVGIGYNAGSLVSGSNNIFLGYQAGNNLTTGSNNLVIGYDVDAPSATASNQLNIGNLIFGTGINGTGTTLSSGKIGIGTTSPFAKLSIHANNGETNTTLFNIASSTASATTSLFAVLNNGNVGVGTMSPLGKLSIEKEGQGIGINNAISTPFGDNTNFSSSGMQGIRTTAYHDGNGNINWVYGAFSDARVYGSGDTQEIKGSVNKGTFYGNGDVTTIIGTESSGFAASGLENAGVSNISNIYGMKVAAYGGAMSGSTANIGNIYGIYSEAGSGVWGSSGNVTNAYNIYLNNYENGGASVLANQYQLYIETPNKGSSNNYSIYSQGGTNYFGGNVGIGTTTPWRTLSVNGTAAFTGLTNDGTGYYACISTSGELATSTTACGASSERFKTNINDLTYGLDTVLQLRPVSFNWKSDFINSSSTQIGFIAEEVDLLIPEVIGHDDKGTIMNLDYPKLTSVIVKAMQELINTLDERISNVLASVTELVADKIKARQEICIDDVCINKDQLRSLLENTDTSSNTSSVSANDSEAIQNAIAPVITITGNNPAVVEINSNYIDLGATAVDYQGNSLIVDTHDLDIVDTTIAGEYTVTYTAFDGTNTSTSTRTVLVEDSTAVTTEPATTTDPVVEPTATTTVDSL